jgi:4-hydroxy-tetrahydrodipicolinate synthase
MLFSADFPEGFRAALSLRGFDPGAGRQPLSDTQQVQIAALRETLQCLLAEEGYADEPIGGCPPGGARPDPRAVDQIVQGVLAELKRRGIA